MQLSPCITTVHGQRTPKRPRLRPDGNVNKPNGFLAALLSIAQRRISSDTPRNSLIVSSFDASRKESSQIPLEEELSWTATKVTWTKGGSVYRTFTYAQQDQQVVQALLAWFQVAEEESGSSVPLPEPALSDVTSTFGPFQRQPPPAWTDDPLPLPTDPTRARPAPKMRLERCLVVFLSDIAFVYSPSGGSHPFQLPFHLRRALAMDKGVLLERAREGKEVLREGQLAELPTLYSLLDPAEEIKVVSATPALTHLFDATGKFVEAKKPLTPVQNLQDQFIFASDRKDGSEPLLVSVNKATMRMSVWSYGRVDAEASVPFSLREEGQMDLPGQNVDSILKDRSTSSASAPDRPTFTTKRKRSSYAPSHLPGQGGDGERLQRRPSAINPATSIAVAIEEADLLEALGETMGSAMNRTASAISALSAADRRGSVTRNELSITMDRMALGVASNLGSTLHMGEMDREATLFVQEGEQTRMVPDVAIEKVWDIDLSEGGPGSFADASAHLFDSRASSPSSVTSTLAISFPASSTLLLLQVIRSEGGRVTVTPLHQLSAIAATPILATRPNVLDLLYVTSDHRWGLVTAAGSLEAVAAPSRIPGGAQITRLESDGSSAITIVLDDGSRLCSSAPLAPTGLALRCLHAISLSLPLHEFILFQRSVYGRKETSIGSSYFEALAHVILAAVEETIVQEEIAPASAWETYLATRAVKDASLATLRSVPLVSSKAGRPVPVRDSSICAQLQAVLLGLHLLAEDCKLVVSTQGDYMTLVPVLVALATGLGAREWVDHYVRQSGIPCQAMTQPPTIATQLPAQPVQIFSELLIPGETSADAISDIHSVATRFGLTPSYFYGNVNPCQTTQDIRAVYQHLAVTDAGSTSSTRCQNAVLALHHLGWTLDDLAKLAFSITVPLREAIRLCQIESPEDWPPEAYHLIRRPDLSRQAGGLPRSLKTLVKAGAPLPIDAICDGSVVKARAADTRAKELDRLSRAVRFSEDRRLEEVERMLQFSEPVILNGGDRTIESLTPAVQQGTLLALSNRTLALPVGFAMFHYRSQLEPTSEAIPILRINLSARILPMPSVVSLVEKERIDPTSGARDRDKDRSEWPEFHTGVAAALQLGFESEAFDSAQISFNRPQDLDAKHAGFLMGLGLVGHISKMVFNQAFEYLKMKHDPTSIGLLLGLAVSYLGTGDAKVTSLLSVHLSALHPPNSSPLNVSGITQSAGLVGLGLLYLATARQTLADIMVKELCGIKVTAIEDPGACREAYALSAGFAFGLIMLGKGKEAKEEVRLLRTFRALILGDSNRPLPGFGASSTMTDVNITSSAATMGLSLMFLKTERQDVADLLELPDNARRLDYVRADLLLLRTLGKSLIMWESVATSKAWVESHLPPFLREAFEASAQGRAHDPDLVIAAWNIVAGACFGIGLKYAGTTLKEAHITLVHYLDRLSRAGYVKTSSVQGKIKRHAIQCCLGVVAMSLAMVMAGTGDVNVLRRLRGAHGHFSEGVTYGTHLSSHMALGLLFLGAGKYTLGTSNAAIAALVIACFPSFPSGPLENRAHLQAYRHLWILAVEPRCLIARDVDTDELSFLPIRIRMREKVQGGTAAIKALELFAPTLIPELKRIEAIQVDSPRYWGFSLHLGGNRVQLASFLRDSTLYVKRRTGHLSYSQDPRGNRSIFTRSKSETGSTVFDLGQTARLLSTSSTGLRDFVASFSDDAESIATVKYLCPRSPTTSLSEYEAYSASILLECLTKDKPDTVAIYQSIFHAHSQLDTVTPQALLALEQLQFVSQFYLGGFYTKAFRPKSKKNSRHPLIQLALVEHSSARMEQRAVALYSQPTILTALHLYLDNSSWPADIDSSQALALYLGLDRVPDLALVEQLREFIQSQDAAHGEAERESRMLALELLLQGVAKMAATATGQEWSERFYRQALQVWVS